LCRLPSLFARRDTTVPRRKKYKDPSKLRCVNIAKSRMYHSSEDCRECPDEGECALIHSPVKHHVSYRENRTINLTPSQHFDRHFGCDKCYLCKTEGVHKRYFAPVDPRTGKGYGDLNKHGNHSWPHTGRWILVCDQCHPSAIGLRISSEGMRATS
jgi:hypothetical protein